MTAPRARLRKTVLRTLPETFLVDKEDDSQDEIDVGIVWGLRPPKDIPKPCWMVQLGAEADRTVVLNAYEEEIEVAEQVTNEPHTYTAGDAFTNVDEWDIVAVQAVRGTLAAVPNHLFVAGTDYEVVDSDADGALDALSWLPGGDKPDDGAITITYTHRMVEFSRSHDLESKVIVNLIADRLDAGQQGATEKFDPQELIDAMQDALRAWFERDLRPALEAEDITVDLQLDIETPFKIDGTTTLQCAAHFDTSYASTVTLNRVRTARKATVNSTLEYDT